MVFTCFLLALPIAYDTRDSTSADVAVGVYGGYGQFAAITRGCSGETLTADDVGFSEGSVGVEASFPLENDARWVMGVRSGQVRIRHGEMADYGYPVNPDALYHLNYTNPYLSYERRDVGLGLGILSGRIPLKAVDLSPFSYDHLGISGHLRIGSPRGYFLMSIGENTPLVAGGGLMNIGAGYQLGRNVQMFTGMTALFYDRPGLLQQGQFRLGRHWYLESAARFGFSEDITEAAGSIGLSYHLR